MAPITADDVVLDWLIAAFNTLDKPTVHFMGGYGVDKIAEAFPSVDFIFNPDWSRTGSGDSMLGISFEENSAIYLCYADTVFAPEVIADLASATGDIVVGIDSEWRTRYEGRDDHDLETAEKIVVRDGMATELGRQIPVDAADGEFTGLIKLSPAVTETLVEVKNTLGEAEESTDVPTVLTELLNRKLDIHTFDISGRWAELNESQDLARFVMRSKADTLEALRPLVKRSVINPTISFTAGAWNERPQGILEDISSKFPNMLLAIRSSANAEDGWASSHAGEFLTNLNVSSDDHTSLSNAIVQVFDSYGTPNSNDQLLVQEMVTDVDCHGVVTTRTMQTGAPYYTINYDDSSGDTTTVTSGNSANLKTVIMYRESTVANSGLPSQISPILPAVEELERLVGHDAVDIEFAIEQNGTIHILQIRPLTMVEVQETKNWDRHIADEFTFMRQQIEVLNCWTSAKVGHISGLK